MTQTPTRLRIPAGFCRERVQLIRQMENDGWQGRVSTNGHMIMRSPDGRESCSIAPKKGSPTRASANNAAAYKRWKRQQPTGPGR